MYKYKVRIVCPWNYDMQIGNALLSTSIESEHADALLCYWAPSDELFHFEGPKAWYCTEAEINFKQHERWASIRSGLNNSEFLFHGHKDSRFRVPHVTHHGIVKINTRIDRLERAIAVVSNFGGEPRNRYPDILLRNKVVTHPLVDLFGRPTWINYRKGWYSRAKPPCNYLGDVPGDSGAWHAAEKRDLLSRYKVCVCMENVLEPYYFTEKFVEAVSAGCIPVYRAHKSIVDSFLKGAKWIDLSEHNDDPQRAIEYALKADSREYQEINRRWIESDEFKKTSGSAVFEKILAVLTRE